MRSCSCLLCGLYMQQFNHTLTIRSFRTWDGWGPDYLPIFCRTCFSRSKRTEFPFPELQVHDWKHKLNKTCVLEMKYTSPPIPWLVHSARTVRWWKIRWFPYKGKGVSSPLTEISMNIKRPTMAYFSHPVSSVLRERTWLMSIHWNDGISFKNPWPHKSSGLKSVQNRISHNQTRIKRQPAHGTTISALNVFACVVSCGSGDQRTELSV